MGGFAIEAKFGVDATGVKAGMDEAVRTVNNGASRVESAGRRMDKGMARSGASIRVSNKKMSGAIVGLARDIGNGMSAADALTNSMMFLGRGVKGAVAGMAGVGILSFLVKKFRDARDSAKDMQEALDGLKGDNLNAQNASVKELVAQFGKFKALADKASAPDFFQRVYENLTGNAGQRANQAAEAKAGANNMLQQVMEGQAGSTRAAHLNATGRHKEAARQAFGVKRAGDRADLEEGLKKGNAGEAEIGAVLGNFDAETRDQLRSMGLRRVGQKGQKQTTGIHPLEDYKKHLAEKGERLPDAIDRYREMQRNARLQQLNNFQHLKPLGNAAPAVPGGFMVETGVARRALRGVVAAGIGDHISILKEIRDAVKAVPLIKMK